MSRFPVGLRFLVVLVSSFSLIICFQNCGKNLSALDETQSDLSSSSVPSEEPPVMEPPPGKVKRDAGQKVLSVIEDDDLTLEVPPEVLAMTDKPTVQWKYSTGGVTTEFPNRTPKSVFKNISLAGAGEYTATLEDKESIVTFKFKVSVEKNLNKIFHTALHWEPLTPGPQFEKALGGLLGGCTKAIDELANAKRPLSFVDEGVISSAARTESIALSNFWKDALPRLGYCAHFADNNIAIQSQDAVIRYFLEVAKAYKGGLNTNKTSDNDDPGNPINERHIIALLYGVDLVYEFMTDAERAIVKKFAKDTEARVKKFMGTLKATDSRRKNNWTLDALVLRSYLALLSQDNNLILTAQKELNQAVYSQYTVPAGWSPRSCANIKSVGFYGSYDFQERDALTYHTKGIGIVAQFAALKPNFLSGSAKAALNTAINVTKDYVLGTKTHKEFVCTTVQFDKDRQKAGVAGFNGAWVPLNAKHDYRFARIVFPDIKSWTTIYTSDAYAAWVKVFVSGRGDVIVYP
ncbi:hypothetical protein [Bdellovibrio sp. HCB-110]|uniref:hypothetical protein n=1 Tax=Bdellovibrio sp. HCB-110 TaxID=3391182 RepID=UPI0039B47F96